MRFLFGLNLTLKNVVAVIAASLFASPLSQASTKQTRSPKNPIEPEIFGAGVLSKGEVYRGCFTPDGRSFYFFKKVTQGQENYRIFVSQFCRVLLHYSLRGFEKYRVNYKLEGY